MRSMKQNDKHLIFERDGYRCYICGQEVQQRRRSGQVNRKLLPKATLDHVIPKSKGGPNTPENLKTCCPKCNEEKGDKIMNDYYDSHEDLQEHYTVKAYGGNALVFRKSWMNRNLPKSDSVSNFDLTLKDTTDNKLYECEIHVAYEEGNTMLDKNYQEKQFYSLMSYVYGSHFCPCNRKLKAKQKGAVVDEDLECEGDRFQIEKITHKTMPYLILYSETKSTDELQEILEKKFNVK